jgi:hypothetical protein
MKKINILFSLFSYPKSVFARHFKLVIKRQNKHLDYILNIRKKNIEGKFIVLEFWAT